MRRLSHSPIGATGEWLLEPVTCPAVILESAPAVRSGPDAMSARAYTTYDYTQTVARAIEEFVRKSRA